MPAGPPIRVELGNTGSKSTIHRYLREIEEESSVALDNEALLSRPIKELIGRLASCLKEEAQANIVEIQNQHDQKTNTQTDRIRELELALSKADKNIENKDQELKNTLIKLNELQDVESVLKTNIIEANQVEIRLNSVLAEKLIQIDSLEEKHRHSRDTLEHYRQSVKEQRDQDQRRHEQQIQQMQIEIRALNQTLSIKQSDITQLNKDNTRLISELGAERKTVLRLESEVHNVELKAQSFEVRLHSQQRELEQHNEQLGYLSKENESSLIKLHELSQWKQDSLVKISKLEAEVSVKSELIESFLKTNQQTMSKLQPKQ